MERKEIESLLLALVNNPKIAEEQREKISELMTDYIVVPKTILNKLISKEEISEDKNEGTISFILNVGIKFHCDYPSDNFNVENYEKIAKDWIKEQLEKGGE